MSFALKALADEITFAAGGCTFPVPLVPGALYRLTGFSQGTLGSYDITAKAVSATEFATTVEIYPVGDVGAQYWGTFDFDTCQLEYVKDRFNNSITGSANISLFPWFNGLSVYGNRIEDVSTLIPSPGAALQNVTIEGASNVDLSLATGNNLFDSTVFSNGSAFIVQGSVDTDVTYSNISNTQVNIDGAGSINLASVTANSSTIDASALGTSTIANSVLINDGAVNVQGTGNITRLFARRGTLNTTGGNKTDVVLETGTLNAGSFTVSRVRLQDANSTLVANISDATKTGYINALP